MEASTPGRCHCCTEVWIRRSLPMEACSNKYQEVKLLWAFSTGTHADSLCLAHGMLAGM